MGVVNALIHQHDEKLPCAMLTQINDVQCVHSAQRFHGGTGAVYVLLRKSDDKKLENRERHQKRMG
ncbi:hypothetical protein JCM19238_4548 [Vibrio ponticus]|nr:hypothetical protein JCM19238_4548 [Vibrio ponticus]